MKQTVLSQNYTFHRQRQMFSRTAGGGGNKTAMENRNRLYLSMPRIVLRRSAPTCLHTPSDDS